MEFQTRSDNPGGKHAGINSFDSLKKAFKAAEEDSTIWKISYTDANGPHRWCRNIYEGKTTWSDSPMKIEGVRVFCDCIQELTHEEFAKLAASM